MRTALATHNRPVNAVEFYSANVTNEWLERNEAHASWYSTKVVHSLHNTAVFYARA